MGDLYYNINLLIIIIVFVQVTKAEEDEKPGSPPTSPLPGGVPAKPSSALKVSIPSELQGVAYIEVLCQKGIYLINQIKLKSFENKDFPNSVFMHAS